MLSLNLLYHNDCGEKSQWQSVGTATSLRDGCHSFTDGIQDFQKHKHTHAHSETSTASSWSFSTLPPVAPFPRILLILDQEATTLIPAPYPGLTPET